MTDAHLSRRKLFALAAGTTSTAALADSPFSILSFLRSSEGELKVKSIVKKYLTVPSGSDEMLGSFYRSLLVGVNHHQDREYFQRHLEKKELEQALESYVLQEFVLSTNYLHFVDGEQSKLELRLRHHV